MALIDNTELRSFLELSLPGLRFDGAPAPSGQRVVYFCHFDQSSCPEASWVEWGNVVLKVSEGISAGVIAYLQKEIEILNKLQSLGFPRLLYNDVLYEDPKTEERLPHRRFLTIEEKIDAQPLSDVADNYRTEPAVLDLLTQLINCLRPLWESTPSLIHRDLKPANILVKPNGEIVVIDLGIVREEGATGVTLTVADWGPCTPNYASPEQATNDKRNISFRSDFFSLGTLCYELLTSSNPFQSGSNLFDETLHNVVHHTPPPLHGLGLCSAGTSAIIEKMMEKKPYRRFRRIDDLIATVNHARERLN